MNCICCCHQLPESPNPMHCRLIKLEIYNFYQCQQQWLPLPHIHTFLKAPKEILVIHIISIPFPHQTCYRWGGIWTAICVSCSSWRPVISNSIRSTEEKWWCHKWLLSVVWESWRPFPFTCKPKHVGNIERKCKKSLLSARVRRDTGQGELAPAFPSAGGMADM